jgi:hypothetical protein
MGTTQTASSLTSPYSASDRARWRRLLLAKGQEIATRLEDLLAGKEVSLDDFSLFARGEPGEPPEKRLRRYFDQVMRGLRAVDRPRFGFDPATGTYLSIAALDATPWIELMPPTL